MSQVKAVEFRKMGEGKGSYRWTSQLSEEQVRTAVPALFKLIQVNKKKKKEQLLAEEQKIWLNVIVKKIPNATKPITIPLPHSLYTSGQPEICLFCKDNEKDAIKKMLVEDGAVGVTKIISILKLKKKYRSHEAKRQLCSMYDLFLADDRIYHLLPPYLGKKFFEKKKYPISIKLKSNKLAAQIDYLRTATFLSLGKGKCSAIAVATIAQDSEKIIENIMSTVSHAVKKIPRGWENVQALYIKTAFTVALPIYNSLPDEVHKISVDDTSKKARISHSD